MVDYYGVRVLQNYNLLNGALVYVFWISHDSGYHFFMFSS